MSKSLYSKIGIRTKQFLGLGTPVNIVAVHSRQINLSLEFVEKWYDEAIIWIKSFGVEPKSISTFGVSGFQEAKSYSFIKADKKLRKRGFDSVSNISIEASPPVRALFETDYHIEASILNSSTDSSISIMTWTWANNERSFDIRNIKKLFDLPNESGIIDYAYVTQISSRKQPGILATLTAFDSLKTRNGVISVRGFSKKTAFNSGRHVIDFLREIYPYQILSPIHLSYRIGKLTLEDWIKSSSAHGFLGKFAQNRWLWEIPEDQLPVVRQVLIENNLLTLYLPDMNRILEDYGKPGK